jgi:hypothetical protein
VGALKCSVPVDIQSHCTLDHSSHLTQEADSEGRQRDAYIYYAWKALMIIAVMAVFLAQ